jgi:hypothetical protein
VRRVLASLILLMPLVAAGQTLGAVRDNQASAADHVAFYSSLQPAKGHGNLLLPLWRDAQGRMLALVATRDSDTGNTQGALDFRVVDVSQGFTSGLRYDLGPHVSAFAGLSRHSWLVPKAAAACTPSAGIGCPDANTLDSARLLSSQVGASWNASHYRLDLSLDSTHPQGNSLLLPRVVPDASTFNGVPLWALDSSRNLSARGRLSLGSETGIDLGASVGRIRLLPGNLLGVHSLGQQSLSLGMDSGALSGHITGRMLQPIAGNPDTQVMGPERHWTTIDLGLTWRLPWQGELRFGAQNLWSSGQAPTPVGGPEPDQSRIPYVQYHQDL